MPEGDTTNVPPLLPWLYFWQFLPHLLALHSLKVGESLLILLKIEASADACVPFVHSASLYN